MPTNARDCKHEELCNTGCSWCGLGNEKDATAGEVRTWFEPQWNNRKSGTPEWRPVDYERPGDRTIWPAQERLKEAPTGADTRIVEVTERRRIVSSEESEARR